jgi:Quinolinate synthetase A protein
MREHQDSRRDVRSALVKVPPLHTAADDAITADGEISGMTDNDLVAGIHQLRRDRNAVILAHNYQVPAVQDLADFVGDSLQLAQALAKGGARGEGRDVVRWRERAPRTRRQRVGASAAM